MHIYNKYYIHCAHLGARQPRQLTAISGFLKFHLSFLFLKIIGIVEWELKGMDSERDKMVEYGNFFFFLKLDDIWQFLVLLA